MLIVGVSLLAQSPHCAVVASAAQSSGLRTNDGSGGASPVVAADGAAGTTTGSGSYSSYSSLPASSKASVVSKYSSSF